MTNDALTALDAIALDTPAGVLSARHVNHYETIRQALKSLEDERYRLSSAYDQLAVDFEARGKLLDEMQSERDELRSENDKQRDALARGHARHHGMSQAYGQLADKQIETDAAWEEVDRLKQREAHLLAANNQYLQRARDAEAERDRLKADLAEACEVLAHAVTVRNIINKHTLERGGTARLKLEDGTIVSGEVADLFQGLAHAIVDIGDRASQFLERAKQ